MHSLGKLMDFGEKIGVQATSMGVGGEGLVNRCFSQNDHFMILN